MNIFQQRIIVVYLLQVSLSHGFYQKQQLIPYFEKNKPCNSYGKRSYQCNGRYSNLPTVCSYENYYDKKMYYPYTSYKYSYIKYSPNQCKRELLPLNKPFQWYINPTIHTSKKSRNVHYLGSVPETRGFSSNYRNSYYTANEKPQMAYSLYTNSALSNHRNNYSNTYNPLEMFPNIYPQPQVIMSPQNTLSNVRSNYSNTYYPFKVLPSIYSQPQVLMSPQNTLFNVRSNYSNTYYPFKVLPSIYSQPHVLMSPQNTLSNVRSNYSKTYNPLKKFLNIYSQPQVLMSQKYSLPNKWKYLSLSTTTQLPIVTIQKINSKQDINLQQDQTNVRLIFPSKIVIRSLGPWAQIGDMGEYKSNGTFSIKYETSGMMDFFNKAHSINKKDLLSKNIPEEKKVSNVSIKLTERLVAHKKLGEKIKRNHDGKTTSHLKENSVKRGFAEGGNKKSSQRYRKRGNKKRKIIEEKRKLNISRVRNGFSKQILKNMVNPTKFESSTKEITPDDDPTEPVPTCSTELRTTTTNENKTTTVLKPTTSEYVNTKVECERINKIKCVCSLRKILSDMDKIISSNNESKLLLSNLAGYSCTYYKPLKSAYKISADMKPRLISNKPKELLVDEESGPKEIQTSTMEELMSRGVPNEGIDFYVFPSINIEIPCITTNKMQLSPNTADSTKYTWTHGNNKTISEGRITEDLNHRGSLQIKGVTMEDSDNYTCTVNFTSPDTESPTSHSFLHTVLVVSEPMLALHALVHYNAKSKCDQEILEMLELYVPQQLEEILCENDKTTKLCNVEIYNPMCITTNEKKNSNNLLKKDIYEIKSQATNSNEEDRMEISLNYEIDPGNVWQLMPSTDNKTHCSPFCQQKVLLKVVLTLKESITEALNYPIESSLGIIYKPNKQAMNVKLEIACGGGLELSQGFCVPCPRGFYSTEGSTKCTECPPGTYQDNIGGKVCEECPHMFKEGCFQMWYTPLMTILFLAIVIIIILLCCLIVYCCRARENNKQKRPCNDSEECLKERQAKKKKNVLKGLKKKKNKKENKKQAAKLNTKDVPPTLPPEDFTTE